MSVGLKDPLFLTYTFFSLLSDSKYPAILSSAWIKFSESRKIELFFSGAIASIPPLSGKSRYFILS